MSLEKYAELKLDMADKAAIEHDIRYSHEEVFGKLRSIVNDTE